MTAMNSRERMLAAIRRQPVDRIPLDIWATGEVNHKLTTHFGDWETVKRELHLDGFTGAGAPYIGPKPKEGCDEWGNRHRVAEYNGGAYWEQYHHALAYAQTVDDVLAYDWPQPSWWDYSGMRSTCLEGRKTHVVSCGYMAPFYFHNQLRGLEQSLVDPYECPELAHVLLQKLSDFFYGKHRAMFEACEGVIDVCQVTDDLGSQTGPLMSLEVYREFYKPHHARFCKLCKEFGIHVFHHDDGSCRLFLPDLAEMGVDVLNPVQHNCPGMDMKELKREFGGKFCFHGGVDNQKILPFGTTDEVRAEVRQCIDNLASDGTGYILAPCHNLQIVTPLENILALYDEAWSYGKNKK